MSLTISTVETDNSYRKYGSTPISTLPHLNPQVLPLELVCLRRCRSSDFFKLGLELVLFNIAISESSKCRLSFCLSSLCHEPSWTLWEEEQSNRLDGRSNEEDGKWDSISFLAEHSMSAIVDSGSDDGPYRELALVYGKGNASKMGGCCFVDVNLSESKKPADRNSYMRISYVLS